MSGREYLPGSNRFFLASLHRDRGNIFHASFASINSPLFPLDPLPPLPRASMATLAQKIELIFDPHTIDITIAKPPQVPAQRTLTAGTSHFWRFYIPKTAVIFSFLPSIKHTSPVPPLPLTHPPTHQPPSP